jgi:PAS domain S-box-containing protein
MLMNETLEKRLQFEKLVSKISSRFISLDDIDLAFNISLEDLGIYSHASRAYIFLFSEDGVFMDNSHEWCAQGVSPEIDNLKGLPTDTFPWWMKKLKNGENILIPDVTQMPAEASTEKEILELQEIKSAMVLPIYVHKELKGFLGFDNVSAQESWSSEDQSLLQITAEIFSNAFSRMQSEQVLRSSESQFRELFHNANDIICVHTLGRPGDMMHFIEVNNRACQKTGYSREEYFTMTPADLCTAEFAEQLPLLQKAIREHNYITYVMEYVTKEGGRVPVEMNSHVFLLNGQEVVMTIGRDITERLRMEQELMKNNVELQEAIVRLKDTQSQLIQQEQLAGIGQLAAGVAHEINNPLAIAMSNCGLLKDELKMMKEQYSSGDNIEDLEEITEDIYEGLRRVDTIVKSLSAFSIIDYQTEFKEYDLQEGIRNTLVVANNAYKYHAEIECVFRPVPPIEVNSGQINQVILNLLLNAAYSIKTKHSIDKKKGVIRFTIQSDDRFVYCVIEDNGTGISSDNISKIFNPFFTTKPVGEGTGLGLSIVYDIMVNKHHGEVEVTSEFGEGAVFTLKFPIKKERGKV